MESNGRSVFVGFGHHIGARCFSGCDKMTAIHLHNVNVINKSCFTNCTALQKVYCSDLITYIGEWAFAYCCSLNEISVGKDTIIDNNAFSNASPKIKVRETPENYLIESDNIYTLAAMQKHYRGMIDAILIDPPYNSNIDYIGYQDVAFENGYLGYMYERLQKAYPILSEKGFMVINIDEGEVANLMLLCKKYSEQKWFPFIGGKRKTRCLIKTA